MRIAHKEIPNNDIMRTGFKSLRNGYIKVYLAPDDSIKCADDAIKWLRVWLMSWQLDQDDFIPLVIDGVSVDREIDGWYATMKPPMPVKMVNTHAA